ncbi:TPA: hypothetical protein ACQQ5N_002703 [Pseudomonas aeruginosa]|uniref:hypothetical protein n=1 Tax=Pseudomonas aeruginosa TaxID=287 RepID=UPI001CBA9E76|nr:hypothetical protein [Pseudomonas aeruginosa]MBZ3677583.1 hypothetical protein [Pseudomonas aeruginosa]MBZ3688578.1 hypothetical protein [Pseudomonas aeruginosa]
MCPTETPAALKAHKLSELRAALDRAVQEPQADLRIWWQGVLHGRLLELEAAGVLSAEDSAAFAAQIQQAFTSPLPPANDPE